ncbi:MAG TPA: phosphotransferase, partial [Streptosporangiaceae bacterium]|nr:phosphotransferase [Streptosporangiaceae bacterium]
GWRTLATSPGRDHMDPGRVHLDQLADLEATWADHAAGDTLLHADLRADNLLLTGQGAMVVDWPWACRGAAFTDLVLFAPSVGLQGGPPPAELIASSPYGSAASPHAVTALVCALAGYLTETSLRPPTTRPAHDPRLPGRARHHRPPLAGRMPVAPARRSTTARTAT